jgi:hypothetical protein
MPKSKKPNLVVSIAASFTGVSSVIIFLLIMRVVTFQLGLLMLVASVAMHLGFGILIAVYRLIARLE